jgi:hypothetical protein
VQITVETPADREVLTRVVRHMLKPSLRIFWLSGPGFLLAAVLLYSADRPAPAMAVACLVLGVLFLTVMPGLLVRTTVRRLWALVDRPCTHRFDSWGIETVSEFYSSRVAWRLVQRVEEIPDHLVLRVATNGFVCVPSAGLSGEDIAKIKAAVAGARSGQATMAG